MEINNRILKINGRRKIHIEKDLQMDKNYKFELSGSLTTISEISNEDGTIDKLFTFDPMIANPKGELGDSMKAQDMRGQSQKFRSILRSMYEHEVADTVSMEFDEFYSKVYQGMYQYLSEIVADIVSKYK